MTEATVSLAEQLITDRTNYDALLIGIFTADIADHETRQKLERAATDPDVPVVAREAARVRLRDSAALPPTQELARTLLSERTAGDHVSQSDLNYLAALVALANDAPVEALVYAVLTLAPELSEDARILAPVVRDTPPAA